MPDEPMDLNQAFDETETTAGEGTITENQETATSAQEETTTTTAGNETVNTEFEQKNASLSGGEKEKIKAALSIGKDKLGSEAYEKLQRLLGEKDEDEEKYPKAKEAVDAGLAKRLQDALGEEEAQKLLKALDEQKERLAKAESQEKEQLQKAVEKAHGEIEKLSKAVTEERRKRERNEFVEEIRKDINPLPGQVDENAQLLFSIKEKVEKDEFDKLVNLLKSASNIVQKSGFLDELGSAASENDPEQILKSRAQEKVTNDPALSLEKAKAQVLSEDPDLYRQLRSQEVK